MALRDNKIVIGIINAREVVFLWQDTNMRNFKKQERYNYCCCSSPLAALSVVHSLYWPMSECDISSIRSETMANLEKEIASNKDGRVKVT